MTRNNSRGYAYNVVKAVMSGNPEYPGNALGRLCIELDIPVTEVAETFGVSRQTIYNWFTCASHPNSTRVQKVRKLIAKLSEEGV